MKSKSNKAIIIITSIVLAVIVGFRVTTLRKTNEVFIDYSDSEVYSLIQNETLSEIMYKASMETHKGPGPRPEKIAYITIDDGPSKYTNQILDILNENQVKATFFMINGNMKLHKEEIKRMSDEGHGVGFHSVSHDIKKIYKTPQATIDEFNTCNETLYEISGETSKVIRLPYGSKPYMPEESYNKLIDNQYMIWDWNLDTEDWHSTTDKIVSNVLLYGRNRSDLVVLMHEKEQSVNALNHVIKVLKERGYTILPIKNYDKGQNFWEKNLK